MELECLPKEGKRDVFTLYMDGKPWRDIHRAIFGKQPKIVLSCAEQFKEIEYSRAKKYVFRRLAVQNTSSFELHKALKERLVSEANIVRIIEECQKLDYINDADWIERFINRHLKRNFGPLAVVMKLRGKGVPEDRIQEHLEKIDDMQAQKERILYLLKTKYSSCDLADFQQRQKVISALVRKGFALAVIQEAYPS